MINGSSSPVNQTPPPVGEQSPHWSATTKLIVGLSIVAIAAGLFFSFKNYLGPFLLALILAYLVNPLSDLLRRGLHLPWKLVVSVVYLILFLLLLGLLTWGGIYLIEQIQSLVGFLQTAVNDLPRILQELAEQPVMIGPFPLEIKTNDVVSLANQILVVLQPILSRAGELVATLATSAVSVIGAIFFTFLIAYFISYETGENAGGIFNMQVPGYREDLRQMGRQLNRIWSGFLRGQLIVVFMSIFVYMILMGVLGVQFYFGLALLGGLGWFLPYIGSWITYIVLFIVSLTQGVTILGLDALPYAVVVTAAIMIIDAILYNLISPRIFSNVLKVHPAAVMVAALIGLNVLGLVGVILAAPVLATIMLLGKYAWRKMIDMDPWEGVDDPEPIMGKIPRTTFSRYIQNPFRNWLSKIKRERSSHSSPKG